ncbi:MAG: nucleotidyltransferase domain-containing protein [Candidatus Pacearchaeota archaeon]
MKKMNEIFEEVKRRFFLTKKEEKEILSEVRAFIKKLRGILKEEKIILGGSVAKKTLIRKKEQDADIFVIFNKEEEMKNLKKALESLNEKFDVAYGSREYFRIKKEKLVFEIVPLLKVKKLSEVKNVIDFSPFHVKYIKNLTKKDPSLLDEIKITKAFCTSQKIYGAESYIGGFSGYSLEVMVCFFGSFINFLKGIQKVNFIDPSSHFRNKQEAFREINESKLRSPLLLVDPVYKYRNLCAGLSFENFEKLKKIGKEFLKNPSIRFFEEEEINEESLKMKARKENLRFVSLIASSKKNREEVVAAKIKKVFLHLLNELKRKKQEVVYSTFLFNGSIGKILLLIRENKKIKIFGPLKSFPDAITKFKEIRKEIFFEGERSFAFEEFSLISFLEKEKKIAKEMNVNLEIEEII